ncbi:hypothetical protein SAY87_001775 [Trapa incisa]|uniref:Uncharacterized protein n=1 Tax=Trapa incisa TaxID=236973 RepID=A0AAN7JTW2_9MYRT|nr:hypothetical protein SAY87_001775 [Trapa incisa]
MGQFKLYHTFVEDYTAGELTSSKVRIQLGQGSAGHVTRTMLKQEGVGAFYKGLSAGLLRQATYTTARLGTFKILTAKAIEANDGKPLPLYQKALCGLTAGAIGACVGSPADLALIRMQADATLPAAQRRNYSNAFNALYRIVADEGVLALWKGAGPTVVRAMALNMGMLASYDQSVEFFKDSLGFGEASTVLGEVSIHWLSGLCDEDPQIWRTIQILHGLPSILCQNCPSCDDDMDIPEPDPEVGEVCWIVVGLGMGWWTDMGIPSAA